MQAEIYAGVDESNRRPVGEARGIKELYIPSLDGIRACAVLLVFAAHAGLSKYWSTSGAFGVSIFFFLSGYLITTLLRQEIEKTGRISLRKFYLRRSMRILPPMYLTLAMAYSLGAMGVLAIRGNLFGMISAVGYFYNYADLLSHKVALPTGMRLLWSLMVEEHFYLVFPFFYLMLVRKGFDRAAQARVMLGLCAAALMWRCVVVFVIGEPFTELAWTYMSTDCRFDSILFGSVLAVRNNACFEDESGVLCRYRGFAAVGGLAVIVASLAVKEPHFRETLRGTLQGLALYPVFYYCISSRNEWRVRWLEWRPLRWIGWISYSMYLIHAMLLRTGLDRYPVHPVLVVAVCLVLTLFFGWLMRIGIELPLRGYRTQVETRLRVWRARRLEMSAVPAE